MIKDEGMGSRLDRVTDWKRAARKSGYRVDELAQRVGVTERHLERYFSKRFGQMPKGQLDEWRMAVGRRYLQRGLTIKEVAERLKFKHVQDFTRAFERVYGVSPSDSRTLKSDGRTRVGRNVAALNGATIADSRTP